MPRKYALQGLVVVGVAAFFAIISPYQAITYLDFPFRWLYWLATVGCAWSITALTFSSTNPDRPNWFNATLGSLLSTPAVFLIIYFVQIWIGYPVAPNFIPNLVLSIWVICFGLAWLYLPFRAPPDSPTAASATQADARPQLSDQLPFEYRDSAIFALEADDHYVHVHTDAGKRMHYIRLRDAIALMNGIPGVKVHRSWWVAIAAIEKVSRNNGSWTLEVNGVGTVPVSKSGLSELRSANVVIE